VNNYWAFGAMRPSDDIVGDAAALRARLDEDGYLYVPGVLDRAEVMDLRRDVLTVLHRHGWVAGGEQLMWGVAEGIPVREGDEAYFAAYDDVQRLESFHSLAHRAALLSLMRDAVGDTAFPHPLKVARLVFPDNPEVSTPPHQDHPNNQGTPSLTAAWVALGDCSKEAGSLAVLSGSHRFGVLPLEFHLGPGNRQAVVPDEVLRSCTWVTTDVKAGDVVLFPSLTVHAALNNTTWGMRLSVDYRYQCEGEELSDMVLHPHFGRLSWDEIYAGWKSDEFQYYWKDLDYTVVPFDTGRFAATPPTAAQVQELGNYDMRVAIRHAAKRNAATEQPEGGSDIDHVD